MWGAGAVVIETHLVQLNPQEKYRHWYKLLPEPGGDLLAAMLEAMLMAVLLVANITQ